MATEGVRALLAGFLWPLAARRALLRASSGRGRLEAGGMASGLPGDISGLAGAAHSETRAGASAWALPGGVSCRPRCCGGPSACFRTSSRGPVWGV